MANRGDRRGVLLLVALTVLLFADVLFAGRGFYKGDLFVYHFPMKKVVRDLMLAEGLPQWNPAYHGGQPLAANPAYELFYPPQWLLLLPFPFGFQLHIVVHFALAAVGMYLFLRSLAVRAPASLLGAVAFAFGAPYLSLLIRLPFLFAMSWLPWVLLFSRRAIDEGRARDLALAAIVFGMQALLGEPVTVLQTGALVAGYAVHRAFRDRRALLRAAIIAFGAFLIAAVSLIPALDHARDSVRAEGFAWKYASNWSTPPLRLGELAYPRIFRALTARDGSQAIRTMYAMRSQPYISEIYLGLLIAVAAFAGLIHDGRGRWWVIGALAVSLLFALGSHTPLLSILHDSGLTRSIRYPEKFLLSGLFVLVVWGAIQVDRLPGDAGLRRKAVALTIVWLVVGIVIWTNTLVSDATPLLREWRPLEWPAYWWTNMARAAAVLALLVTAKRSARWWPYAIVVFTLADLSFMHTADAARAPRSYFEEPEASRGIRERADYRLFHKASWDEFALDRTAIAHFTAGEDTDRVMRDALFRFSPAAFGFQGVLEQDLDQTQLLTAAELQRAAEAVKSRIGDWHPYFLESANVRWIAEFAPPGSKPPIVLRDIGRNPRYWFAARLHGGSMVDHLVSGETARGDVFVSEPFVPAAGRVVTIDERPSRVRLTVESSGKGLLVASIARHKHWRATVDGRPAALVPANLAFQAVIVPAGRHVVELRYGSPLLIPCLAVSLVALVAALAAAVRPARD